MHFKGNYLRVLSPRTRDGNSPILIGGVQQYKETHLPLSARKHLEKANRKKPTHLREIIEEVNVAPIPQKGVSNPIGAEVDAIQSPEPVERRKPGPKPKTQLQ